MDMGLQAKLLRLIQEQTFYRIGGTRALQVDVRVLAATNQNPAEAVTTGRFREDLYYRLNVVPIHLPALRERREDISLIANRFLLEFSAQNNREYHGFDLKSLNAMENYPWGGNVRELRNIIQQIVVLNDGGRVSLEMLPEHIRSYARPETPPASPTPAEGAATPGQTLRQPAIATPDHVKPFWQVERDQIQQALDLCGGNVQEVARRLEISPATLYRKIEKYGLVR